MRGAEKGLLLETEALHTHTKGKGKKRKGKRKEKGGGKMFEKIHESEKKDSST